MKTFRVALYRFPQEPPTEVHPGLTGEQAGDLSRKLWNANYRNAARVAAFDEQTGREVLGIVPAARDRVVVLQAG